MQENKRLLYIDALKGFAILLVVAGHWMIRLGLSGYDKILWTFIVSVHLPLFFFVSGFLLEGKSIGLSTLLKRSKMLLIPGIIFFTIYMILQGSSPLSFVKYGFQEYWFTFVLFEMLFMYFISTICFKKYKYVALIILSIAGVGYLITPSIRGGQVDSLLCLENVSKYFQFFTFGILCKLFKNRVFALLQNDLVKGALFLLYVGSFLLCFNEVLESQYSIFYKLNHDLIFRYLGVLVFLSFFIYKEEYFKSRKIVGNLFIMMGQRSLDIYLIHYFLLPVVLILPSWLNSNQMWYWQLLILAVLSFLVIGGCLLISNVIRMSSFLSQILLGVRKQN